MLLTVTIMRSGGSPTTVDIDARHDVVRVAASFLVVIIHVSSGGFITGFAKPDWWAYNVFDSLSRASVPLFFMLSGALLVPRDFTVAETLKRAGRIVLLVFVWSYFYLLVRVMWYGGDPALLSPLRILRGPVEGHLWFLYALFGVYLFLPVLQAFYRSGTRDVQVLYLATAFVGASVLPMVVALLGQAVTNFDFAAFAGYAAYAFLGAILAQQRPGIRIALWCAVGFLVASALTAAGTWWLSVLAGKPDVRLYLFTAPLVVLASACAFVAIGELGARMRGRRLMRWASSCALGIYVIHVFVMQQVYAHGWSPAVTNPWIGIPLISASIWFLALLATAVIRLVPGGRAIA